MTAYLHGAILGTVCGSSQCIRGIQEEGEVSCPPHLQCSILCFMDIPVTLRLSLSTSDFDLQQQLSHLNHSESQFLFCKWGMKWNCQSYQSYWMPNETLVVTTLCKLWGPLHGCSLSMWRYPKREIIVLREFSWVVGIADPLLSESHIFGILYMLF